MRNLSSKRVGYFVLRNMIYILCIVLLVVPTLFSDTYLSGASITILIKNIAMWGTMAIGVSFVILLGCNDLSVGMSASMMTVIAVLIGNKVSSLFVVVPVIMIVGICAGVFNGFLVGTLNMNPWITTLGTQMVFKGIGLLLSNGTPIFNNNAGLLAFYEFKVFELGELVITLPIVVMLVLLLAATYVLKFTNFGQSVYIVGGNKEAAQLSGINTRRVMISCYAISGFCASIAALMVCSLNSSGNGAIGERYSLQTVAACALGGIQMNGGYGNALRAVLGVTAFQLITKVLYLFDASMANLQVGIIGAILLVFMLIDQISTSVSKSKVA